MFRLRFRQLYYRLKGHYNDQGSMNAMIQRLALQAKVSLFSLGVMYEARGSVTGCAELFRRSTRYDETAHVSAVDVIQSQRTIGVSG